MASGAPRCTSTWLQTIAAPLPTVATPASTAATAIVGDADARPKPTLIRRRAPPYTRVIPSLPSAGAAKKLPKIKPTPVAATRKPRPRLPEPISFFAKGTSPTLTNAVAIPAVLQTTRTVTRWREWKTTSRPSRRSAQWPRVIGSDERSALAGIRLTINAERTNVAAFAQYAISGPDAARSAPARIGPSVQAMCSTVVRSEVACSRSSSETRFGMPAQTAGRKNPVAMPLTPASATIAAGSSTNGSATKVPARMRSETIISRRRERRSTSGPSVTPMTTIGRKSAIRRAASHRPESVLSRMSTESARAAR